MDARWKRGRPCHRRRLAGLLLAGAAGAGLLLGGCSDFPESLAPENGQGGPDSPGAPNTESLARTWLLSTPGCEQRLLLSESGSFEFSARIGLGNLSRINKVRGDFALDPDMDGEGAVLRFNVLEPIEPHVPVYCDQWRRRAEVDLGFPDIAGATGINPATLTIRSEVSPLLGPITLGSDDARTARFALWQGSGGELKGAVLTDAMFNPPLYQTRLGDPNHWLTGVDGFPVVNLPAESLSGVFADSSPDMLLFQVVLNFSAAVEVTFAPVAGSGQPLCEVAVFEDTVFAPPETLLPFDPPTEPHRFFFNPKDPAQTFFQPTVRSGEVSATAYVLPVAVRSSAGGGCSFVLSARPSVVARLEDGAAEEAFSIMPLGPATFRVESRGFDPERLLLAPFGGSLVRHSVKLDSRVVALAPLTLDAEGAGPDFDLLGLLQAGAGAVIPRLNDEGEPAELTLFAADGSDRGLGPFHPYQRPPPLATLAPPATREGFFQAAGEVHAYRVEMENEGRVAIWSEGGLAMRGELLDPAGRPLAENRENAADGAGFYLVRTLAAGAYDLLARNLGQSGTYTLQLGPAPSLPFSDDALATCAVEGGWLQRSDFQALTCRGRSLESLDGLQALPALTRLEVDGNLITDLSELAGLENLRELSLAGNHVNDLSPLAGLGNLRRLSLAGNPLDSAQLPLLGELAAKLSHLDLTGVSTLSMEQAAGLRGEASNLILILPDGTVAP